MARRFPDRWLDELRSRTDLVQTVNSYVPLKKNGRRWWGLCPFHGEKTASFSVDEEQQLYYCFGCKAAGTVIHFVMEMEKLTFQEAVIRLAEQAHMELPQMEDDPGYQQRREQQNRLYEANREAAKFYHNLLYQPEGAAALQYLQKRGLTDTVIRRFGLGASSDQPNALTRHLVDMGYSVEELKLAGLTVIKEDASGRVISSRDMFRNRAMFPIIDRYDHVIAFGGRSLGDALPKYLNTGDTPIFNKRRHVYAENLLRKERQLNRVVLVEGYMDVIALNQYGVKGVCATLGTALTEEQAVLLKRFAPQIYLSYDGDGAGQKAILRGLDILETASFPAKVLDFPDKMDPDEFIRAHGAEGFEALPALRASAYRMLREKDRFDLSTGDGKLGFVRACMPILQKCDPVERELCLQDLMIQTGFARDVLMQQLQLTEGSTPAAMPEQSAPARRAPIEANAEQKRAEELLISLLATGRLPADIVAEDDFTDDMLRGLYQELASGKSPAQMMEDRAADADRGRIGALLLTPMGEDTHQLIRMAKDCVSSLRRQRIEARIAELMKNIAGLQGQDKLQALQTVQQLNEALKETKARFSGD